MATWGFLVLVSLLLDMLEMFCGENFKYKDFDLLKTHTHNKTIYRKILPYFLISLKILLL